MIVSHIDNVKGIRLPDGEYNKVTARVLINPENGWEGHVMRLFELGQGGYSGDHSHDFQHIVMVVKGEGELILDGVVHPVKEGSFMYIPNNAQHQLRNTTTENEVMRFMCIVPEYGHTPFE